MKVKYKLGKNVATHENVFGTYLKYFSQCLLQSPTAKSVSIWENGEDFS